MLKVPPLRNKKITSTPPDLKKLYFSPRFEQLTVFGSFTIWKEWQVIQSFMFVYTWFARALFQGTQMSEEKLAA